MAKKQIKAKVEKYNVITTPSAFGSHKSMVVEDPSILEQFKLNEGEVVLKDDAGHYVTYLNRLDTGLADPRRYSTTRGA